MTVVTTHVAVATDDGSESGSSLDLTTTGVTITPGWFSYFRFANVVIPQGSTINSATFTTGFSYKNFAGSTFILSVQTIDNAPVLVSGTFPSSSRTWLTGSTYTVSIASTPARQTFDITSLLAAIIGRAGWVSGNAILLMQSASASRPNSEWGDSIYQYEATQSPGFGIADLVIDYSSPTSPPVVSFTRSPSQGYAPLTVQFTDTSQFATSWLWDFGDGQTSTLQNPSHSFASAATYTVTLTATNAYGSNSTTASVIVTVRPPYNTSQFMTFF